MATNYASLKVPELKKLLTERGLAQTGNKADLIARLEENDGPSSAGKPDQPAEDEIDWDDEPAAETEPKQPAAAPAKEAAKPAPAPAAETSEVKPAPAPAEEAATTTDAAPAAAGPELSQHLAATDAEEEAKKRAARAKRFGPVTTTAAGDGAEAKDKDDEAAKRAARAAKFGIDSASLVKGLDSALPDRPRKRGRGREGDAEGDGAKARGAKRATPDRRDGKEGGRRGGRGGRGGRRDVGGGGGGRATRAVLDDPEEKRKAEARAKRFAGSA